MSHLLSSSSYHPQQVILFSFVFFVSVPQISNPLPDDNLANGVPYMDGGAPMARSTNSAVDNENQVAENPPTDDSSSDPQPPLSTYGVLMATLNCSQWTPWEFMGQCMWPVDQQFDWYPESCRTVPVPLALPNVTKDFLKAKQREWFDLTQKDLRKRGLQRDSPCGMCSYKAKCRRRTEAQDSVFCATVEREIGLDPICDSPDPCTLSLDKDGECSPPLISGASLQLNRDKEFQLMLEALSGQFPLQDVALALQTIGNTASSENPDLSNEAMLHLNDAAIQRILDNPLSDTIAFRPQINPFLSPLSPSRHPVKLLEALKSVVRRRHRVKRMDSEAPVKLDFLMNEAINGLVEAARKENINEWNCIKNATGAECICCCGVYFPDSASHKCVDVTGPMTQYVIGQVQRLSQSDLAKLLESFFGPIEMI